MGSAHALPTYRVRCNNEALAREGIDTQNYMLSRNADQSNNEALAREGIDTSVL